MDRSLREPALVLEDQRGGDERRDVLAAAERMGAAVAAAHPSRREH